MSGMNLTRMIAALACTTLLAAGFTSQALAQHEGSAMDVQDGHAELHPGAGLCPGCEKEGGLCAHCEPMAVEILSNMSAGMCPDCDSPDALCEKCTANVAGAMEVLGSMNPGKKEMGSHEMVCLAMTLSGDFEAAYGQLFDLGAEQGLLREDTVSGSIIPDAAAEIDGNSDIYLCFSKPGEGGEPQDPLFTFSVPENDYAVFRHFGPDPGFTWMAAYTWLAMADIEVEHAPAGEHHIAPPDENGNMTMDILIPVDAAQFANYLAVGVITEDVAVIHEDVAVIHEDVGVINEDVGVIEEDVAVIDEDVAVIHEDVAVINEDVGVINKDVGVIHEDVGVINEDAGVINEDVGVIDEDVAVINEDVGVIEED